MKFFVDAQLPYQLCKLLNAKGHDAIHTDDLPSKERTHDNVIRAIVQKENRILITKDSDFENSFYLQRSPKKLLIITTGNIKNNILYALVNNHIEQIEKMFKVYDLIELDNYGIIGHE
ncbi:MAG: DUF5615 family PIN-like protein [Bacteroidetes bacterium]|nr:DUF5615 family PIN-like protein [Bacteroidota bacterium]